MPKSVSNDKTIKNRKPLEIIFNVVLVILLVVTLFTSGLIIFAKTYYTPFWVNGQSMYPTLNKDAKHGDSYCGVFGGHSEDGDTHVDYGIMDTHKKAIDNLKRFDIITTKFFDGDDSIKIKRIVGLPGEKLRFTNDGDLYVNDVLVDQPIEDQYKVADSYPIETISLKSNEYYTLGDNRAYSYDSREVGPIKKEWIVGKAVAICGYCVVKKDTSSDKAIALVEDNVKYIWPRFL